MKIYIVSEIETTDNPNIRYSLDIFPLHYASTYDNVIQFLRRALEDSNSGLEDDTVIDVAISKIDEYFYHEQCIERKPLREYLK